MIGGGGVVGGGSVVAEEADIRKYNNGINKRSNKSGIRHKQQFDRDATGMGIMPKSPAP
jgi:hypothetical protein